MSGISNPGATSDLHADIRNRVEDLMRERDNYRQQRGRDVLKALRAGTPLNFSGDALRAIEDEIATLSDAFIHGDT